jgi:hypothetical protein
MKPLLLAGIMVGFLLGSAPRAFATCSGGAPNGVLNAGEECDDGDTNNNNCCTNSCVGPCVTTNPCKDLTSCTKPGQWRPHL